MFVAATFRGLTVAVKILRQSLLEDSKRDVFRQEMAVLSCLQHPNICLFIGYRLQPELSVVMEYCSGGDLAEAAKSMTDLVRVSCVCFVHNTVCC